jgi:hypothetical protein
MNVNGFDLTIFSGFNRKFNQANVAGLNWTVDENLGLSAPQEYQVESKIDTLSQEVQSYTIATAVLGALLGLALVAVVVYLVYVKKLYGPVYVYF